MRAPACRSWVGRSHSAGRLPTCPYPATLQRATRTRPGPLGRTLDCTTHGGAPTRHANSSGIPVCTRTQFYCCHNRQSHLPVVLARGAYAHFAAHRTRCHTPPPGRKGGRTFICLAVRDLPLPSGVWLRGAAHPLITDANVPAAEPSNVRCFCPWRTGILALRFWTRTSPPTAAHSIPVRGVTSSTFRAYGCFYLLQFVAVSHPHDLARVIQDCAGRLPFTATYARATLAGHTPRAATRFTMYLRCRFAISWRFYVL